MTTPFIQRYVSEASQIVMGCMGLGGSWDNEIIDSQDIQLAHQVVDASLESGINFFDHADIYKRGKAEKVFAEVLKQRPEIKDNIIIQSKCGIRFADENTPGRYDFSKAWILDSVDGILSRLNTDKIDILLLHRPDLLMDTDEVAKAFDELSKSGKVEHFGVSNMHAHQHNFLQSAIERPLIINQLEMSLSKHQWLNESVDAGMDQGSDYQSSRGLLEYAQTQKLQLQAWGSLSNGLFTGRANDDDAPQVHQTAQLVSSLAEEYGVSPEAILIAWLMRHPAAIQPVIGTTNIQRIKGCAQAMTFSLSREHWYQLFITARGEALP